MPRRWSASSASHPPSTGPSTPRPTYRGRARSACQAMRSSCREMALQGGIMNLRRPAYLLILGLVLASAPPTFALVLPGGKAPGEPRKVDKASDCWVGLEVADADVVASNKKNKVIQKACPNTTCLFHTQVCVDEATKKCPTA